MKCLFCEASGPFTAEHVFPAAIGNDDMILIDQVCGKCNSHFNHNVEGPILTKSPIAFWRAQLGIRNRNGQLASVDLSQPPTQKGRLPSIHHAHDDGIGFEAQDDGSTSVDIADDDLVRQIESGERTRFQFVLTPRMLFDLGRFLCKCGIELICHSDPSQARDSRFQLARRYARFGEFKGLWPILYFTEGQISDSVQRRDTPSGPEEDVQCYNYSLCEVADRFLLFKFGMGTDRWVICLTDPFPTPEIKSAFQNADLKCIWYSQDQFA